MARMPMGVRIRLSAMMFLQYMLIAVWFVQLTAYLKNLEMTGLQMALIASSMALGCLASPLVGMIADRNFSSERVLAFLNLATGVLLLLASQVTTPFLMFLLLLVTMVCYMPTWGLTSSIAMTHSPSEKFPQIRVFGSIGWVAAGLFGLACAADINVFGLFHLEMLDIPWDGTAKPMIAGGAVSIVAGLFAFALPHTPPPAKGQKASVIDVMGLRSLGMMRNWPFAVLVVGYLICTVAFALHWSYGGLFLQAKGFESLVANMNWGQLVEIFLMLLVPIAIVRWGLKWTMVVGLLAQVVRYAAYALGDAQDLDAFVYTGILVHGVIFGFFYVGAQVYADRKAPKEMKAQAQGLLFLIFGVGLLIGNFLNGGVIHANTENEVINWQPVMYMDIIISAVVLVLFALLFRDPVAAKGYEAPQEAEAEAETDSEMTPAPTPPTEAIEQETGRPSEGETEPPDDAPDSESP